jgi:FAD/FMN-containing dehydrogenase
LESVALERELRRTLQGEVRFDDGHRALYATDSSNYRHVPVGVVFPRDDGDVEAAVAACSRFGAPVLTRGAGTSLAGQACNVAVVLDTSRHLRGILDLDPTSRRATVQAGIVLDRLQEAAAAHGLMFGADPSTHACCTLGGMIGNNACGVHSLSAGKTVDNVEELEVLTSDGVRLRVGATDAAGLEAALAAGGRREEIYRRLANLRDRLEGEIRNGFPRLPRRVSGYNLDELLPENGFHLARALVGSEGTCAVILSAVLRLVPREPYRTLLVLGYPDVVAAAEQVPAILEHRPEGLEGMDAYLLEGAQMRHAGDLLPSAGAWLMAELGGPDPAVGTERARRLLSALGSGPSAPTSRLCESPEEQQEIWRLREAGVGTTSRMPGVGDTWPGWEDSAVPPERLGPYLQAMQALFGKHGLEAAVYGHFGDGCVHTRLSFRLGDADGVRAFRTFMEEAADLVVAHGGSLSGEHGDGQARGELLSRMYGSPIMEGFREFKSIWDPGGLLNPGKLVDARPLDSDLRLPGASGGAPPKTHFDYAADDHSFARAVLRCVGVGKCRREDGGLMCPSYMATREEEHSTRGRARLLGEMVRGEVVRDGWRDGKVKEALDLCLSCKGCKNDCPAGVDMATYKAEFLSHYHESRSRPLGAYAAGYVAVSARLGMVLPGFVNAVLGSRSVGGLVKRVAGIAPERRLPRLAKQSFRGWFRRRSAPLAGGPRVLLWPDTFTNYYQPHIAVAAVRLLEGAGYQV